MPEFLSDAWLAALDDAARAAGPLAALAALGDHEASFVLEQVVRADDAVVARYQVVFSRSGLRVRANELGEFDVCFTTDRPTAVALARGETNAQRALAAGQFRVSGNVEGLIARADALVALDDVFAAVRAATTYR